MFKKLLIASAVFAVSSGMAFAGHASYKGEYKGEVAAPCPVKTFAAGPYIGLSIGGRNNYAGTPAVFKGLDGILSVGYGAMLNPSWYLAGELYGMGTANLKDMNNLPPVASTKSSWSWGGSVIPGFMVNDSVLAFLRVGGQSTRFNGAGATKGGWHVGLGGQTNVYENWDIRGEYIYESYGSVANVGKISSDRFVAGVVYKFV